MDSPSLSFTTGDKTLAHSWLLVLIVAPIIIVLLVWLLILLRRRHEQSNRRLLCERYGCAATSTHHSYLLECSPSTGTSGSSAPSSSTTSASACRESSNTDSSENRSSDSIVAVATDAEAAAGGHHRDEGYTASSGSCADNVDDAHANSREDRRRISSSSSRSSRSSNNHGELLVVSPDTQQKWPASCQIQEKFGAQVSAFIEHTNLYLVTLTYQEIIGCLAAFSIAILNIVRMRNLFCCNLVIFVLTTSKLLNLLTLTTFSLTKLAKLFQLKPLEDHRRQFVNLSSSNHHDNCREEEEDDDAMGPQSIEIKSTRQEMKESQQNIKKNQESARVRKIKFAAATTKSDNHNNANKNRQPVACRLLILVLISSILALICLYLRLMTSTTIGPMLMVPESPDEQVQFSHNNQQNVTSARHQQQAQRQQQRQQEKVGSATRLATADDWSLSIYAPTTTEASARYSSEGVDNPTTASGYLQQQQQQQLQQAEPNHQASWSSRFQQSSQLKQLLEQFELQQFAHLLLDTHLQTSRFSCTLAANNYAPVAKLGALTLYAFLMLLIMALSLAILLVGNRQLRQLASMAGYNDNAGLQHQHEQPSSGSSLVLTNESSSTSENLDGTFVQSSASSNDNAGQCESMANGSRQGAQRRLLQITGGSSRKRYSELLKQSVRHHQSSLEMSRPASSSSNHQRRQQQQQQRQPAAGSGTIAGGKRGLRNSSSMSSLLALPEERSTNKQRHQQQQQQQQQASRRLFGAQSMANLACRVSSPVGRNNNNGQNQQSAGKIPAGKLAISGGQLAWLPLGSAATVASLSNIGNSGLASQPGDTYRQLLSPGSRSKQQRQQSRAGAAASAASAIEHLGSIGEHRLVDCGSTVSLDERDERLAELLAANDDSVGGAKTKEHATNITVIGVGPAVSNKSQIQQQLLQQQQQQKQATNGAWPLYSNQHAAAAEPTTISSTSTAYAHCKLNLRRQQQQQQLTTVTVHQQQPYYYCGHSNSNYYVELKKDLRVAQSMILFVQLLNHAPILILLALANLLPEGLLAGWNSTHDNGFVWLTLIEALTLPLLLCIVDSRLGLALKRSLKCNKRHSRLQKHRQQVLVDQRRAYSLQQHQFSPRVPPLLAKQRPFSLGTKELKTTRALATSEARQAKFSALASRGNNRTADFVLGPSASYPDFMFACPAHSVPFLGCTKRNGKGATSTGADLDSCGAANSFATGATRLLSRQKLLSGTCHALTGPPYPLFSAGHEQPLAIDTHIDSLRANFALMSKAGDTRGFRSTANFGELTGNFSCIGTAQLLASRRAMYSELILSGSDQRQRQQQQRRQRQQQQRRERRVGGGSTCAILSATRRLFRLGRGSGAFKGASRRGASSGYLVNSNTSTTDNNTMSSSGGYGRRKRGHNKCSRDALGVGRGGISPTSSLSTLIRKFNHDNYTSVCQQYEQRKQQIAVEMSLEKQKAAAALAIGNGASEKQQQQHQQKQRPEEILIDGLDCGTSSSSMAGRPIPTSSSGFVASKGKQAPTNVLLDSCEEAIFCRKGGLYYNYCLSAESSAVDAVAAEKQAASIGKEVSNNDSECSSRVNPLLVGVCAATGNKLIEEEAIRKEKSSPIGSGGQVILLDLAKNSNAQQQKKKKEQEQTNGSAIARKRLVATTADDDDNHESTTLSQSKKQKETPGDSVGECSKLTSGGEGKNRNNDSKRGNKWPTVAEVQQQQCSSPSKAELSTASNNNSSANGSEPIIGNITSVQELLDKMNGIIAAGSSVEQQQQQRRHKQPVDLLADGRQQSKNGRNRSILEMVTKNNNGKQATIVASNAAANSNSCANQLRQLTAAMAATDAFCGYNTLDTVQDYASLRSVDDALSLVSVSSEFEYHNISQRLGQHDPAEQQPFAATTKEAESELQNVALNQLQRPTTAATASAAYVAARDKLLATATAITTTTTTTTTTVPDSSVASLFQAPNRQVEQQQQPASETDRQQQFSEPLKQQTGAFNSSSSQSIDTNSNSRRLEDLRFPSFLPTKKTTQAVNGDSSSLSSAVAALAAAKLTVTKVAADLVTPPRQQQQSPRINRPIQTSQKRQQIQRAAVAGQFSGERANHRLASSGAIHHSSSNNVGGSTGGSDNKSSSSLLNLTTAKFAAMSAAATAANSASGGQDSAAQKGGGGGSQLGARLPPRIAGSSGTITKQRGGASSSSSMSSSTATSANSQSSRIVSKAEFGFARQPQQQEPERSLPSESGNVRARIRKMEQQSSTPNLNNNITITSQQQPHYHNNNHHYQHQQQASSNASRSAAIGSILPTMTTSTSKLPVLASTRAIQSSANSNQFRFLQPESQQQQLSSRRSNQPARQSTNKQL